MAVVCVLCLTFSVLIYSTSGYGGNDIIKDGTQHLMTDRELVLGLIERVQSLEKQNIAQQALVKDGQLKVETQAVKMTDMEKKLMQCTQATDTKQTANQRTSRQVSGDTVAFTAIASKSVGHYGAGNQDIQFEHVDLNVGNAYNPSTGTFIPPVSGIYVISVSILSVADRETSCDIVVNGVAKARIYSRGSNERHGQGSQTVAFHLEKDDIVSVRNEAAGDDVQGGMYTSFSAFRLPEEPSTSNIIG